MHAAALLLSPFSAEQPSEGSVSGGGNAIRAAGSEPENTGALEPEDDLREERTGNLGMEINIHVIVHYCHVTILHCPYTCLHPALLTVIIQYLFHSTKPDLPCTMEIPDFDAGY